MAFDYIALGSLILGIVNTIIIGIEYYFQNKRNKFIEKTPIKKRLFREWYNLW